MNRWMKVLRWTARVWSIVSIIALLLPFFVEGLYWLGATSFREVIGHICFLTVLIGLIVAWRHEGWGGGLVLAGTGVFYLTWWLYGKTVQGPFLLILAAPGLLFVLYWLLDRTARQVTQSWTGRSDRELPGSRSNEL
jgi:hypothetical protein